MLNWKYPLIIAAGIMASILTGRFTANRIALTLRERLGLAYGAFCGAMIAAKLPYLLLDWRHLLTGEAWLDNGKTILAGLAGGYLGVELAKRVLGLRLKTGDSFAAPVAVGIAIGRLGCFSAGCCYGLPTDLPWAVKFSDGIPRHPCQLYEFAFHLTAAGMLLWAGRRGWLRGQLIKAYIVAYLFYRFLTEIIRPEPRLWWGLTGYQWAALGLLPVFGFLWIRDARFSFPLQENRVSP